MSKSLARCRLILTANGWIVYRTKLRKITGLKSPIRRFRNRNRMLWKHKIYKKFPTPFLP